MAKKKKETPRKSGARSPTKGRTGKGAAARKGGRAAAKKEEKPGLPAQTESLDDLDSLKAEMNRELARLRQRYVDSERERDYLHQERMEVRDLKDTISNQLVSMSQSRSDGVAAMGAKGGDGAPGVGGGGLQSAILEGPGAQPRVQPAPPPEPPSGPPPQSSPSTHESVPAEPPGPDQAPEPQRPPPGLPRAQAPHRPTSPADPPEAYTHPRAQQPVPRPEAASLVPADYDGPVYHPREYQSEAEDFSHGPEAAEGDEAEGAGAVTTPELSSLMKEVAELRDELRVMVTQAKDGLTIGHGEPGDQPDLLAEFGRAMSQVRSALDEIRGQMKQFVSKVDIAKFSRTMDRVDQKIAFIEEEIGMGEALDVGKMPPHIIEIVYQATLDDIVRNMYRELGPYDTERHIDIILDDIHRQTSGSELFFFDGERLRTRTLSEVIQKKLISAKQVHMTYVRLLDRLKDTLPGYKPKNFRAMIRLKSQEFTIDRVLHLMDQFSTVGAHMDALRTTILDRIGSSEEMTEQVHGRLEALVGRLGDLGEANERTQQRLGEMGEVIERLTSESTDDGPSGEATADLEALKEDMARLGRGVEATSAEVSTVSALLSSRLTKLEGRLETMAAGPKAGGESGNGGSGGGEEAPKAQAVDGEEGDGTSGRGGEGEETPGPGEGGEGTAAPGEAGEEPDRDGEEASENGGFPGVITLGEENPHDGEAGEPEKDPENDGE